MILIYKKKNLDNLDFVKYVLSIMVVIIHTNLLNGFFYPWVLIAVPLFFVISSYLLFRKINNSDIKNEKKIIFDFVIRQLKLYFFWFLFLLPLTILFRIEWFDNGLFTGIRILIRETLFSSTFIASWFIVANIEATLLFYFISRFLNSKIIMFLFIGIYCLCALSSTYLSFFYQYPLIINIYNSYVYFFGHPFFSFPFALIWIFIGKIFADNSINIKFKTNIVMLILSIIIFYLEWVLVRQYNGNFDRPCYFLLLPLVFFLFSFILKIKVHFYYSRQLRMLSIIIYPLHASVARFLKNILLSVISDSYIRSIVIFLITIILCHVVCYLIAKFEKKFTFLKYSH